MDHATRSARIRTTSCSISSTGGSESGAAVVVSGNGIGAPREPRLSLSSTSNGDGTSTVTARGTALRNGDGSTLRFGIVREGQSCS